MQCSTGKQTHISFAMPFYTNDPFIKTGSGQTSGKHSKREIYALSYSPLAFFDVTPTGGCLNQPFLSDYF
eukprot:COSAG06_NODE_5850_length_3246_cov_3.260248_1_plen_70_part_00